MIKLIAISLISICLFTGCLADGLAVVAITGWAAVELMSPVEPKKEIEHDYQDRWNHHNHHRHHRHHRH